MYHPWTAILARQVAPGDCVMLATEDGWHPRMVRAVIPHGDVVHVWLYGVRTAADPDPDPEHVVLGADTDVEVC